MFSSVRHWGVGSLLALLLLATTLMAAEGRGRPAKIGPVVPNAESVDMFAAIEKGDIEVKLIPKDSTECRVTIKNKTKKPLNVKLPEAFAGVPVLGQAAAAPGAAGRRSGGGGNLEAHQRPIDASSAFRSKQAISLRGSLCRITRQVTEGEYNMHVHRSRQAGAGLLVLAIASAASAAESPATADEGLGEVIVTAQRREENLQKAAVPITAIDGDVFTDQSVTQAADLTRLIPSIQVAPAAALTQIYLRGVGTFGANAFAEQGVSFNLDGVYLSRPAAPAALFYDLERVEVLKGPQGTLYGRNATGGAVNLVTASRSSAKRAVS